MRFIHTADNHLGATPDAGLSWGRERAQALWTTFRGIITAAGEQNADLLLIAGDLFHRQPLQKECREVNALFSTIPHTRVVIIAGNHDYIHGLSPYETFAWEKNVTVLSSATMDSVYFSDLNTEVHGLSYHSPEIREPLYDGLRAPDDGRFHILLGHGGDDSHIPIRMERLAEAGFHYTALGHIHQPRVSDSAAIAYCGSPEPMDRTDMGQRGYIQGELTAKGCRCRWIPSATARYVMLNVTVNPHTTTGQLADLLRQKLKDDGRTIYRVTLTGTRSPDVRFEPDTIRQAGRIADVIDRTEPDFDLEKLQSDHAQDLISHYIRALSGPETTSLEHKALCYGLRALLNSESESIKGAPL